MKLWAYVGLAPAIHTKFPRVSEENREIETRCPPPTYAMMTVCIPRAPGWGIIGDDAACGYKTAWRANALFHFLCKRSWVRFLVSGGTTERAWVLTLTIQEHPPLLNSCTLWLNNQTNLSISDPKSVNVAQEESTSNCKCAYTYKMN